MVKAWRESGARAGRRGQTGHAENPIDRQPCDSDLDYDFGPSIPPEPKAPGSNPGGNISFPCDPGPFPIPLIPVCQHGAVTIHIIDLIVGLASHSSSMRLSWNGILASWSLLYYAMGIEGCGCVHRQIQHHNSPLPGPGAHLVGIYGLRSSTVCRRGPGRERGYHLGRFGRTTDLHCGLGL